MILVALVLAVMTIVGTFLASSLTEYNISAFRDEMSKVFTPDFILSMENAAADGGTESLKELINAYSSSLGISGNRVFSIIDGKTGKYIDGSDDEAGAEMALTPNILTAMNGEVGQKISPVSTYLM